MNTAKNNSFPKWKCDYTFWTCNVNVQKDMDATNLLMFKSSLRIMFFGSYLPLFTAIATHFLLYILLSKRKYTYLYDFMTRPKD